MIAEIVEADNGFIYTTDDGEDEIVEVFTSKVDFLRRLIEDFDLAEALHDMKMEAAGAAPATISLGELITSLARAA